MAERLIKEGKAYYCYASKEELEAGRLEAEKNKVCQSLGFVKALVVDALLVYLRKKFQDSHLAAADVGNSAGSVPLPRHLSECGCRLQAPSRDRPCCAHQDSGYRGRDWVRFTPAPSAVP